MVGWRLLTIDETILQILKVHTVLENVLFLFFFFFCGFTLQEG
jgi:hypothetical protein